MLLLEVLSCHSTSQIQHNSVEKMASNQSWNEECVQPCKRGGMHQLKEVDMLSAKMDLLIKKLED
jgi:hypothetical protein